MGTVSWTGGLMTVAGQATAAKKATTDAARRDGSAAACGAFVERPSRSMATTQAVVRRGQGEGKRFGRPASRRTTRRIDFMELAP